MDELDVRPPEFHEDDAMYVEDDDVVVVKTEECQDRRVFMKSSRPPPTSCTVEEVVISSDSDSEFAADPSGDNHDLEIPGKDEAASQTKCYEALCPHN